mmetsp:Transcript_13448/g.18403  ORF Transcript_13448/g.18403 Transcript_13448/m.18403 type:complete len:279 (+) Transcript_13448:187-1023(+)|eukprot:CAMPEP_0196580498 /NCGR_PEP_ID=MMETSP1081-20130531/28846_1 /TAXON_ID=36882 /ORGANISM="Pyramimonas amylifera, Strain CCMP720" /LENGTH=278 /DNA_ID=CAMNT_0041900379 /DNA_START=172 /DNA_END=1008 /DNA_ORIENTATION=+
MEKHEEKKKDKATYGEGDKVLVPEGKLFYEAKILTAEKESGRWKYLVHYQGWNKKWDEWLLESRMLPSTDATRKAEKHKLEDAKLSMRKSGTVAKRKEETESVKVKKRKVPEKEDEDQMSKQALMHIALPASLKRQLISDWERITKHQELVPVPRSPSVAGLLQQYLAEVRAERKDTMEEVVQGIQGYFDKALPNILLYSEEREQCEERLKDGLDPAQVYGAEHLLRLFIKLPELLPYKNMEEAAVRGLEKRVADIVTYLQKNETTLFVEDYEKKPRN